MYIVSFIKHYLVLVRKWWQL